MQELPLVDRDDQRRSRPCLPSPSASDRPIYLCRRLDYTPLSDMVSCALCLSSISDLLREERGVTFSVVSDTSIRVLWEWCGHSDVKVWPKLMRSDPMWLFVSFVLHSLSRHLWLHGYCQQDSSTKWQLQSRYEKIRGSSADSKETDRCLWQLTVMNTIKHNHVWVNIPVFAIKRV